MLVFVYGTLTDSARVDAVLSEWSFDGPAVLWGLRRIEGRYPTLVPPGERADGEGPPTVEGRLLLTPEVGALDDYEGVDAGLYVRVSVPLTADGDDETGRPRTAAVYVGDPERLGVDARWPAEGTFAGRVRAYVDRAGVVVERR